MWNPIFLKFNIIFTRKPRFFVCVNSFVLSNLKKNFVFPFFSNNFSTETLTYTLAQCTWARAFAFLSFEEQERGKKIRPARATRKHRGIKKIHTRHKNVEKKCTKCERECVCAHKRATIKATAANTRRKAIMSR